MNLPVLMLRRTWFALLGVLALLCAAPAARAQDEVRGVVTDPNGQPVFNADFNVYDAASGNKLAPSDKTDALGKYRLIMPTPGHYDLLCRPPLVGPPPAVQLAPQIRRAVYVNGSISLDYTLPVAAMVRARVFDPTNSDILSNGMFPCDLDFDRSDDGTRQPAFGDVTNVFGNVQAFFEPGNYTVSAFPDTSLGFAPVRVFNQTFPTANPLSDVLALPVERAVFLNGFLRDDLGAPVAGAVFKFDVQVDDTTTRRMPSWKHVTGADGSFHIGVAPGVYRVTVEPSSNSLIPYAAARVPGVDLGATRTQDFTISRGVLVTGRVTDKLGQPVGQADWDAILETGAGAATPGDNTQFDGTYRYVVAPGVYRLRLTPPASTGLDSVVFRNVALVRDTVINVDYAALGGGSGTGSPLIRFAPERNPTHTQARIVLVLDRAISSGLVEVYDVSGKRVRELVSGAMPAGTNTLAWDGRRANGAQAHTGVYFVRARLDGHEQVLRFVLLP